MVMMFDWMLPVGVAYQTLRGSHDMGEFGKEASPKDDPNNPPKKKKDTFLLTAQLIQALFQQGKGSVSKDFFSGYFEILPWVSIVDIHFKWRSGKKKKQCWDIQSYTKKKRLNWTKNNNGKLQSQ